MTDAIREWPYLSVSVDGKATADGDGDGENKVRECRSDLWTDSWRRADRGGRSSSEQSGFCDSAEFAILPACGRMQTRVMLFDANADSASAIARYGASSLLFTAALRLASRQAYGATPHASKRAMTASAIRSKCAKSRGDEA